MPDWPHLRNAPITEALLDIRVDLPPDVELDTLARFQDSIRSRYPHRKDRLTWQGQLKVEAPKPFMQEIASAHDGYLFYSNDSKQVVQARKDGFSFSRLKPYETWPHLRDEAKELWEIYRRIALPIRVKRIAVRYIDRMELPLPFGDLRTWILTIPSVAPTLPQGLSDFLMRVVLPFPEANAIGIVTQTIEAGQLNVVPLIFDIDIFRECDFDISSQDIWEAFESLREIKNRVFFESITRKTEDLFR